MSRRGWIVAAVVIVALAVLGQQQFGAHRTPPGQPALTHLDASALETLRADFNEAAASVRVILLLSPT